MTGRKVSTELPPGTEHLAVLTMEEAARLLRCSRAHVYVLHERDGLPVTRIGGRTVVRASDLDAWLADRTERAS